MTLQVGDLERSLAFYQGLLGLQLLGQEAARAQLGALDGAPLLTLSEHPGARPVPRQGRLGLYHVALLLPSRAALGQFLAQVGGSGLHVGMSDHLFSEALYLTDPDGLGLEVYADRPRDAWPRDDRGLVGATLPLEVQSVLDAADPTPFAGIPAGSKIGHVHFHVADLALAAAFYQRGLGFQAMMTLPSALFVSAGGYHHHVGLNTWAAGAPIPEPGDARLLEWQLVLPDAVRVTEAVQRLEAAGFTAKLLPDAHATATDPWQTTVRLLSA